MSLSLKKYKFEDLKSKEKGSFVSGPFGSNISSKFFKDFGVPVIRGNNLTKGEEQYKDKDYVYISTKKANELKNCIAIKDDIIFTSAGTLGQIGILPKNLKFDKYIISNKQIRFRCNTNIVIPLFLYFYLINPKMRDLIESQNKGSSIPLLTLGSLKWLPIYLPSLKTQKKIINILSTYFDLIKNNQTLIKLLEEYIKITYLEWFLHFNINGKKLNIDKNTNLPFKWKRDFIGSYLKFHGGYSFKSKDYEKDQKYKIVTIKNVQDGNFSQKNFESISVEPENINPNQRLYSGDYVMSLTGNVGRVCLVYGNNYLLNQRVVKIESNKSIDYSFFYAFFRNKNTLTMLENISYGTAQQNLSTINIEKIKIPIPNDDVREKFNNKIKPIVDQIINLNLQNMLLVEAKDILLPRLVEGIISSEKMDSII